MKLVRGTAADDKDARLASLPIDGRCWDWWWPFGLVENGRRFGRCRWFGSSLGYDESEQVAQASRPESFKSFWHETAASVLPFSYIGLGDFSNSGLRGQGQGGVVFRSDDANEGFSALGRDIMSVIGCFDLAIGIQNLT